MTLERRLYNHGFSEKEVQTILKETAEWLKVKRQEEIKKYVPPMLSVYDDLIKEFQSNENKAIKPEGQ